VAQQAGPPAAPPAAGRRRRFAIAWRPTSRCSTAERRRPWPSCSRTTPPSWTSRGDTARGKAAILDRFATGFARPSSTRSDRGQVGPVLITPDVAQVEGTSTLSARNEPSVVDRFVPVREEG